MFATPRKLPSGSWRIQIYVGEIKGKKIRKSFTGKTKKECFNKVKEYWKEYQPVQETELTVQAAIQQYLTIKEGSISPSTYTGYEKEARLRFDQINTIFINKLDSKDVQYWISTLLQKYAVKTVKNAYGLLAAVSHLLCDGKSYKVSFPVQEEIIRYIPTDKEVKLLSAEASKELKICILLAAFGTLRRGEIAALKYKDIDRKNGSIYVHATFAYSSKTKSWIYKAPKTKTSIRTIFLPDSLLNLIPEGQAEDFIWKGTPDNITGNFRYLRNRLGLKCRFHDLRIYSASIRAYLGIPLKETQAVGGWKSRYTLEKIYDQRLRGRDSEYNQKTIEHFETILK